MLNLFCIRPISPTKGINVGNDVIFEAMQRYIRGAFGRAVNLISVPACARPGGSAGLTARTIYDINQHGDGVIVGGGNLYENGELDVGLDALGALHVPLMLFSVSWGRVYGPHQKLVARTDALPDRTLLALHQKAHVALVRDLATRAHIERLGGKAELGGCPTLFLERSDAHLDRVPWDGPPPALLSIRNPGMMCLPSVHQARVRDDILGILAALREAGHRDVRLLCHDQRDLAFAAGFKGVEHVFTTDARTYLAMLQSCALNVTYRLHSFLPCLALGTPAIKISYDERALSLIETVSLDPWNIDMVRCEDVPGEVARRLRSLDELEHLKQSAAPRWNELHDRMERGFRDFAAAVRSQRG
jgi:polysaccharide pyruvyl transferase WcaK-like protein